MFIKYFFWFTTCNKNEFFFFKNKSYLFHYYHDHTQYTSSLTSFSISLFVCLLVFLSFIYCLFFIKITKLEMINFIFYVAYNHIYISIYVNAFFSRSLSCVCTNHLVNIQILFYVFVWKFSVISKTSQLHIEEFLIP